MAWTRYVAIGDSFTEGLGDPYADGEWRGWADRVAEALSARVDGFGYANLAVRGRLLDQIIAEQLPPALDLKPDLVSISGGGNDLLRPKTDVDALAGRMDAAVARIRDAGADVVLFTGVDPVGQPVISRTRGRVAVFNELLRGIAARRGAHVVDQWSMDVLRDSRMWGVDRLHMSSDGHRRVALATLEALGVEGAEPGAWREPVLAPLPELGKGARRLHDLRWARGYLAPWVGRRLRGRSSGDAVTAKRPALRAME
ncbi:SGNH/GDSL hydrolase family protein [Spirillospora sp. CA-294931]|uniref:SGNH/GDSL hydrolase family protein n=1 Tax=Spirillospora sp. CA-294931 TaxID=3240042 RepID=UPI003D8EB25E